MKNGRPRYIAANLHLSVSKAAISLMMSLTVLLSSVSASSLSILMKHLSRSWNRSFHKSNKVKQHLVSLVGLDYLYILCLQFELTLRTQRTVKPNRVHKELPDLVLHCYHFGGLPWTDADAPCSRCAWGQADTWRRRHDGQVPRGSDLKFLTFVMQFFLETQTFIEYL